jgi:hypothetical protein
MESARMTVSSLSICLALKKIADITCGKRPEAIHIKVLDPWNAVLTVSLPSEYESPIFSYLAQHIGMQAPKPAQPLLLTSNQAVALVELARRTPCAPEAA